MSVLNIQVVVPGTSAAATPALPKVDGPVAEQLGVQLDVKGRELLCSSKGVPVSREVEVLIAAVHGRISGRGRKKAPSAGASSAADIAVLKQQADIALLKQQARIVSASLCCFGCPFLCMCTALRGWG